MKDEPCQKTVKEAGQTKIGAYARGRHHKCIYRGTQRNWKADGIKGAFLAWTRTMTAWQSSENPIERETAAPYLSSGMLIRLVRREICHWFGALFWQNSSSALKETIW